MSLGIQLSDPAEASAAQSAPRLMDRYQSAYRVAATACDLGSAVKVIGLVVGAAILLGSFGMGNALGSAAVVVVGGTVLACLVAVLFWILGTLVSAFGENLKAGLDTAVYSSTFLNNAQRAKIMSLG